MEASATARYHPVNILTRVREFITRRGLLCAVLVPFVLCSPLLSHKGLFEFGDANFPLRPFPLDYLLPWQSTSDGGVDNVLIGLPRIAYYAGINFVELISFSLQFAQWLWYSGLLALGVYGGYLLAQRFGAGRYAVPLGLFWALNFWSYDRVSQGPLFLAYQALPIAIFFFIRYLDEGKYYFAAAFAASTFLLTPSLQIAYIATIVCATIALYFLIVREERLRILARLGLCGVTVALFNAYFLTTLLADVRLNAHNSLHLVGANFSNETFIDYSARATLGNALQLGAFFYSTLDQEPYPVHTGAWLPFVALLGVIALPPLWRERRFWAAIALFLAGVWLVSGATLAQNALLQTRAAIPGLRSFVEPDYLTPFIILGYLAVLSFGAAIARRTFGTVWPVLLWLMVAAGIAAFIPGLRPLGGLPQTPIPKTYIQYARSGVEPRVLWIPAIWVARYKWSPYTLNGFNVLNSPADYMGPYMLEWVPPHSREMVDTAVGEIEGGHASAFVGLTEALGIRNVAVSADQLDLFSGEVSESVREVRPFMLGMARQGIGATPVTLRDGESRLITQHLNETLPVAGVYQSMATFNGGYQFLGDAVDALTAAKSYRPLVFDDGHASGTNARFIVGRIVPQPGLAPPPLIKTSKLSPGATAVRPDSAIALTQRAHSVRDCTAAGRFVSSIRDRSAIELTDRKGHTICASATIAVNPRVDRDVQPRFGFAGKAASPKVQLIFFAPHHPALFVDVSDAGVQSVPAWAQRLQIIFYGTPHRKVRYASPELLRWSYHGFALSEPPPANCAGTFQRTAGGMLYHMSVSLNGSCALALRQSFSSLWVARTEKGNAEIGRHQLIDGYANGWDVRGDGPSSLEIYNSLLAPFRIGSLISAIAIVLAIGFSIVSVTGIGRMRRA